MRIGKILIQEDVPIAGTMYDVLIPLPANADECMRAIGITDFDDADAEWDSLLNRRRINESESCFNGNTKTTGHSNGCSRC